MQRRPVGLGRTRRQCRAQFRSDSAGRGLHRARMNQEQFSDAIQQAYKEALKGADAITANAEAIRREAEAERDAAREARRAAEAEGERLAREYFEKARVQLMEAAVTERLRQLTRAHLEAGRAPAEICDWLGVSAEFVEAIREVVERVDALRAQNATEAFDSNGPGGQGGSGRPGGIAGPGGATLRYQNYGRGGTIWYEDGKTTFDMWWEFAGGDALVIVDIPTPAQWPTRTKLPLEKRQEVLTFVGHRLIADHNGGRGSFVIGENVLTIYGT